MNGLFQAALEVQGFMQRQQWRFCIIGGLAVLRWGEPRLTQDVDLSSSVSGGRAIASLGTNARPTRPALAMLRS